MFHSSLDFEVILEMMPLINTVSVCTVCDAIVSFLQTISSDEESIVSGIVSYINSKVILEIMLLINMCIECFIHGCMW